MLFRARVLIGRRDIQIFIRVSSETLWKWIGIESNGVDHDFSGCVYVYTYACLCPHVFMYVHTCTHIYFLTLPGEVVQKQRPSRDDLTFTLIPRISLFSTILPKEGLGLLSVIAGFWSGTG